MYCNSTSKRKKEAPAPWCAIFHFYTPKSAGQELSDCSRKAALISRLLKLYGPLSQGMRGEKEEGGVEKQLPLPRLIRKPADKGAWDRTADRHAREHGVG